MSDRQHFDLARFVLDFLEQEGSIVTPPAFGVYEVLMPDDLAASLGVDAYLRLSFDAPAEDAVHLTVNHPLVDAIAERMMAKTANARGYINAVRLQKRGIAELAQRTYALPNARIKPGRRGDLTAKFHYLRFNFKVTYESDEKEEEIRSVVMDVQGGYAVRDEELLERLETYEATSTFQSSLIARPRWKGAETPFSFEIFQALLDRAEEAVREDVDARVQRMTARLQRFLELDIARIEGYYDDLAQDLLRRRERVAQEDEERARSYDEKLAALEVERENKLRDVESRYRLQVKVELINVLLLEFPKIYAPIIISNRTASITRYAVWNPLVHRLEPLTCDVCGKPGEKLYLCTGGHLAHETCLAPQCIDCKRVYCQLCADQVLECAVCHQPVCQASLIRCPECGRGTCREHQGLCHANQGEPVDLATLSFKIQPPPEPESEPKPEPKPPSPKTPARSSSSLPGPIRPQQKTTKSKKRRRTPSGGRRDRTKAVRIHVEVHEDKPLITAFVMKSARKELAIRHIELTPEGIEVICRCEKGWSCPVDGYTYRPLLAEGISGQIRDMLEDLRQEYGVPARKVTYYYMIHDHIYRESQVFVLPAVWKDEARLRAAQQGYDRLS